MVNQPSDIYVNTIGRFAFSPAAAGAARTLLAKAPAEIFHELINDQESEGTLLAAKQILDAFAAIGAAECGGQIEALIGADGAPDLGALHRHLAERRERIRLALTAALGESAEARKAMLRERAALSLIAGCWLDALSQPATQPAAIVNLLYTHHVARQGEGVVAKSEPERRRRALEQNGLFLPDIADITFAAEAGTSALTFLLTCFYLSLSRYPANRFPEVIGTHYAYYTLGIDDLIGGGGDGAPAATNPETGTAEMQEIVRRYAGGLHGRPAARELTERFVGSVLLCLELEERQARLLAGRARAATARSLDDKVAAIFARHAPHAGKQHGEVRVGGARLVDIFDSPSFDAHDFVRRFRQSPFVKPGQNGGECRFMRALKFGGPMFGIFNEEEARTLKAWVDRLAEKQAEPPLAADGPEEEAADPERDVANWMERIRSSSAWLQDVELIDAPADMDDREFFYRLINIENFPHMLPLAKERAREGLRRAEQLFHIGKGGKYTDATFFDYSPHALKARMRSIYRERLLEPYVPLKTIPSREEVVFVQKTYALGNLIDGSWLFRIGRTGHYVRASDGMMFAIYADEMGRGDLRKNHIALIYNVLSSMSVTLPHIGDPAFLDQDEILDDLYPFAIHQICLALFPNSFYPEIIGYNLAIEMFGLGELRLHEIQKLRHWGFDTSYEETHLSIDNVSAGHSYLSSAIVMSYLDQVAREFGESAVQQEWRRIWTGYASFAQYVETAHDIGAAEADGTVAEEVI